jgi:hypothetical protein
MNPWPSDGVHAFYQRAADSWWAERMCYGREFTCRRVVDAEAAQVAARVDASAQALREALAA